MANLRHEKDCLITKMYYGFGDNIMLRPFMIELASRYRFVYADTPFIDLYYDIPNIRIVVPYEFLFTHKHHSREYDEARWYPVPDPRQFPEENKIHFDYQPTLQHKMGKSFFEYIEQNQVQFKNTKPEITFPPLRQEWMDAAKEYLNKWFPKKDKPIVFIHIPTLRNEWKGSRTRNCRIEYIQAIMDRYKDKVYFFDIAFITEGEEERVAECEGLDIDINDGSIGLLETCAMLTMVDLAVFPVGWYVWAAEALGFPSLCLWGGFISSKYAIDRRHMCDNMELVLPKAECDCLVPEHDCPKDLDMKQVFKRFERLLNGKEKHNTR